MSLTKVTPFMISTSFPNTYETVNIPSDYATLQAAFNALAPGVFISGQYYDIVIESGHALTAGLDLAYGDYSHFRISSVDATVNLAASFNYVDATYRAVMKVSYAIAPQWNIKVDCGAQIGRALMYVDASSGYVYPNKGAINSSYFAGVDNGAGIYVQGASRVLARNTIFTGNGRGAWITRGSNADLDGSNFSNSEFIGLYASRGCGVAFENGIATDCGTIGIDSNRSIVMANGADVSRAGDRGFLAENVGFLAAFNGIAQNCTQYGASSENLSMLQARGVNASGAGVAGFRVTLGSQLEKTGATGTSQQKENIITSTGLVIDTGLPNQSQYDSGGIRNNYRQHTGPSLSINNDSVAELDLTLVNAAEWGVFTVASSGTGNGHANGNVRYRVGTSPALTNISLITTTNVVLTTGVLTGTTGSVGDFTMSAATDGKLYFENRTGSQKSIRLFVTG